MPFFQSQSHQRLPAYPAELPGPGSSLGYPPTAAPSFLLPLPHFTPINSTLGHYTPTDRRSHPAISRSSAAGQKRSRHDPPSAASETDDDDEESVDDPTFVPPLWTEPQPAAALSHRRAPTTANQMSSLYETAAGGPAASCLKVRVDILKTPLDKLQQLGRSIEAAPT